MLISEKHNVFIDEVNKRKQSIDLIEHTHRELKHI